MGLSVGWGDPRIRDLKRKKEEGRRGGWGRKCSRSSSGCWRGRGGCSLNGSSLRPWFVLVLDKAEGQGRLTSRACHEDRPLGFDSSS